MKKNICIAVVMSLILSVFLGGCSNASKAVVADDVNKEVTLKWVMPSSEQKDFPIVQAKINEELAKVLPHTKLELVLDPSMADKWALWMAGKTPYDIAHSGFATDLLTEISKKSYLPLNDLIDKFAPTIKAERDGVFKENYQTGTYKGELYAIPNNQYYVKETKFISIPNDLRKYMDVTALVKEAFASPTSTENFYKILDSFFAKITAAKAIDNEKISNVCDIDFIYRIIAKRGFEFAANFGGYKSGSSGAPLCYRVMSDKVKIVNFHDTEEFKTFIKYSNMWYKKGYISKDVLSGGSYGTRQPILGANVGSLEGYGADHTLTVQQPILKINLCNIAVTNPEHRYSGAVILGELMTFQSIPSTAENPERAIKLLELLRTEKGAPLLNLICYGIEGVHYKKVSAEKIKAFDYEGQGSSTSKYGIPNWMVGTQFNEYVISPYNESIRAYGMKYFTEEKPKYHKTPVFGLTFDNKAMSNKISQVVSITSEFEPQLVFGVLSDNISTYTDLINREKTAGLTEIIANYQKQADDYVKTQK